MNIDNIIENVAETAKKENITPPEGHPGADLECIPLADLMQADILTDDIKTEIYIRLKDEAEAYIENYTASEACKDPHKKEGMFKCCHESWQACIRDYGLLHYRKNKIFHDIKRERREGGSRLRDELLFIGLEVYESLTEEYRKVFQITDCCYFLGIDKDYMYTLNDMHSLYLKKAHTAAEASLRIGALTGRGNVTGHAIILNHDYDYTRTTQIIHTSDQAKTAAALPDLSQAQDIVCAQDRPRIENIVDVL